MSKAESPEKIASDVKEVALIAGPTASGKSDLAVELALKLRELGRRSVVINADSAQVYADLEILSARPAVSEMKGIEHRLYGAWDAAAPCSAADWAHAAKREIDAVLADGGIPILCGGTGLYIRTLLEGIAPVPDIRPDVRDEVRGMTQSDAREALAAEDPAAAIRLAPADNARTTRALEVIRSTGRTLTEWQAEKVGGIEDKINLHPCVLLPDRDWLKARCDLRFEWMFDGGATGEVARLLDRNLDPTLPVMRAIGVREIALFLSGKADRSEAIELGQRATRQYAKRQYTWFRNQTPALWPRVESEKYDYNIIFASLLRN